MESQKEQVRSKDVRYTAYNSLYDRMISDQIQNVL
jgi:hypothetical protein